MSVSGAAGRPVHAVVILARHWLADQAFELVLEKPPGFTFEPGQYITLRHRDIERDYTLTGAPGDPHLSLFIRHTGTPGIAAMLARAPLPAPIRFTGPAGHFTFAPAPQPAVFVATGVGITPFVAMARSPAIDFTLLHGVRTPDELYFADLFRARARAYIPCISQRGEAPLPPGAFAGRVTGYLEHRLPPGAYAFYLSGRREMIRDATWLADERFPGSLVHAETFY